MGVRVEVRAVSDLECRAAEGPAPAIAVGGRVLKLGTQNPRQGEACLALAEHGAAADACNAGARIQHHLQAFNEDRHRGDAESAAEPAENKPEPFAGRDHDKTGGDENHRETKKHDRDEPRHLARYEKIGCVDLNIQFSSLRSLARAKPGVVPMSTLG